MRLLMLLTLLSAALFAQKPNVETLFNEFKAEGATSFDAKRGEKMWQETHTVKGKTMACTSCHGTDLTKGGKHMESAEAIDPMAPSVTKTRFDDLKHTKKWFKRNCKEVLERECTAQEKGDFLSYILTK